MLSQSDNELICRVGPGTPMGELMRRYWIPALASRELKADGAPMRLMLLGEKLIAFRDTPGRVGIMDHAARIAAPRCSSAATRRAGCAASITAGSSTSTASASTCRTCRRIPGLQGQGPRQGLQGGRAQRRGLDLHGPAARRRRCRRCESMSSPEDEVDIGGFLRDCNWLQALEGDIDTSHVGFLHGGMFGPAHGNGLNRQPGEAEDDPVRYDPLRYGYTDKPYKFEGSATDWGTMYGAFRPVDDATNYWRLAQFIFPFWTITPTSPIEDRTSIVRAWVPLDDTHVHVLRDQRASARRGRRRAAPPTTSSCRTPPTGTGAVA